MEVCQDQHLCIPLRVRGNFHRFPVVFWIFSFEGCLPACHKASFPDYIQVVVCPLLLLLGFSDSDSLAAHLRNMQHACVYQPFSNHASTLVQDTSFNSKWKEPCYTRALESPSQTLSHAWQYSFVLFECLTIVLGNSREQNSLGQLWDQEPVVELCVMY